MSEARDPAAAPGARTATPTGGPRPIRVLLADDHAVFRQGLRQLLDLEDDLAVVGEAATGEEARALARLGERELALVRLLVEGKSNKEMARALGVAESTVKNQLSPLFRKLGVQDRTQAAVYALAHGLVPEPGERP